MKIAVDANKQHPGIVSAQQLQLSEDITATFFREFRKKQAEMHIDDATFYKAVSDSGPSLEQKAMLKEWDAKTGSIR